jgi:hypothetical protein
VLAGESAAAGVTLPWWLAVTLAVVAGVAPFVTGWLVYRAATTQTKATQETAAAAQALEASKSHRDLILHASALIQSKDAAARELGYAMLEGIADMPRLSRDDAKLVQSLTRAALRRRLEQARRLRELENQRPRFWQRTRQRPDEGG